MSTAATEAVAAAKNWKPETRYSMSKSHIKSYYGLNVQRGTRVEFEGQPGRVTGLSGQYLLVRLDNQDPKDRPLLCHPTWHMAYPDLGIEASE